MNPTDFHKDYEILSRVKEVEPYNKIRRFPTDPDQDSV